MDTSKDSPISCLQTIADRNLREGSFAVSLDEKVIAIKSEIERKKGKINLWRLQASIFSFQGNSDENFLANLKFSGQATRLSLRHNSKSIAISHDSQLVASGGSENRAIKLWQVGNDRPFHTLAQHSNSVVSVAFNPNGSIIAGGAHRTIKLWDLAKYQSIQELYCPEDRWIDSVAFSSDGEILAAAAGHKIYFWEWKNQNFLGVFPYTEDRIYSLAFRSLQNQHQIACGLENGKIILLDLKENKAKGNSSISGHSKRVHFLAFSSDQKRLVSGSLDGTIKKWKVPLPRKELPPIPSGSNPSDVFKYEPKLPKSIEDEGEERWGY